MVKSWSLPIAGTCDAEASVPKDGLGSYSPSTWPA